MHIMVIPGTYISPDSASPNSSAGPVVSPTSENRSIHYRLLPMTTVPPDRFTPLPSGSVSTTASMPSWQHSLLQPSETVDESVVAATPMYQPFASTHSLEELSPEQIIILASQLPIVGPEIPILWNTGLERLRSIYLEGIPPEVSNSEIIQLVSAGALEKMRRFVEKRSAILVFLRYESALRFYSEFYMNNYELRGHPLNIGWVQTPPTAQNIQEAVENQNASRNVYIEQHSGELLKQSDRESYLTKELSTFGTIENVHSLPRRSITFVYFTSISSAVAAVNELRRRSTTGEKNWGNYTISYGKDPCQSLLKLKKQAALLYLGRSPYDTTVLTEYDQTVICKAIAHQSMAAVLVASISGGDFNIGNRCIYIGNCPSNTKLVDICNTVRGGMIENIRFFGERGICFVTFLEPCAAAQFYATYRLHRLLINGKSVKVGWGKHSGPLDPSIERAISRGVTRNICIKDMRPRYHCHEQLATEEEIAEKFASFGPIEQIKMAPELGCIFITFVCISKTMKAVEWAKANRVIPNSLIQYGKDRCATFPRFLMNHSFRTSYNGNGLKENGNYCNAVLIQYLRRELSRLMHAYLPHSLTFLSPALTTASPIYYPVNPYYGAPPPMFTGMTNFGSEPGGQDSPYRLKTIDTKSR